MVEAWYEILIMNCKVHAKYKGIYRPRKTKKYKNGCPQCWKIWHANQLADQLIPFIKPWEETFPNSGIYSCNFGKTYTLV